MPETTTLQRSYDALLEDLDAFLTARLCLILLPVRAHLHRAGCRDLAEAVQTGVRNIRPTLIGILADYKITSKEKST